MKNITLISLRVLFKFFWVLTLFLLYPEVRAENVSNKSNEKDNLTTKSLPLVSASSIIRITYDNNKNIVAAKYSLESAEYAFKQFERGLSEFTPFIMNNSATRDTRKYPSDENGHNKSTNYNYKTRVGMKKEFFDGSEIFGGLGYRGETGDAGTGNYPFAEAEYKFPLFGSYTTLQRITDRTFEENEVFNARLSYVNAVRDTIRDAQENYFWLQIMLERLDLDREALKDYQNLLSRKHVTFKDSDRRMVDNEIKSVQSEITKNEGNVNTYRVLLQDQIGIHHLNLAGIERINLYTDKPYGQIYLSQTTEQVIQEAKQNDAEIRILALALKNSELKRNLARKGKWDIFGRIEGSYDFTGEQNYEERSGYNVGVGLDIRLIDPTYLKISLKRAEAEINKYNSKIARREEALYNLIDRKHASVKSLRQQADELRASMSSRKGIFEQKRAAYLEGKETMDNLIAARKSLLDTQINLTEVIGDFWEIITELDQSTGIYFKELGLSIEQTSK